MKTLDDNSIGLLLTDPPYYRVKNEPWDRQWDDPAKFIEWMGLLCEQWHRILKPNGSLYVFASPKMAARVECEIGKRFEVLNNITWAKPSPFSEINYGAGNAGRICKEAMRQYYPNTEHIIFAEHYGADSIAKGEKMYGAKCDEARGFIFEPLRRYLADEWSRAGLTKKDADTATGSQMAGHYLTSIQWALPTREKYGQLRAYANKSGGDYLKREYDDLKREYDDLQAQFQELRRPFSVSADVPFTDVWEFKTVSHYKGKHPCEKPSDLLEHIIKVSSRHGATVLDCFMGTGSAGVAAKKLGRSFIGIERDETYFNIAKARIESVCPPIPSSSERH